jgi:hypothetical protein
MKTPLDRQHGDRPVHVIQHLSAYLDHELDSATRERVDAHLHECATCAGTLDELRRIVSIARHVAAEDGTPDRDLWSDIRLRLESSRATGAPEQTSLTRRATITLSVPQLAAAAVLLMAVSAATAWVARSALPSAPATPAAAVAIEAEVEPPALPDAVRPIDLAEAPYESAVADLERALQQRRNDLNPRTVEILVRNLTLIDAAIAQARLALEDDPGNSYLHRHLVDARRRKLDLLRRATAITEGN